jgi:hypothetical protein
MVDLRIQIDHAHQSGLRAIAEAEVATAIIEENINHPDILADKLIGYVFSHHPSILDLPPQMSHRYLQAAGIMDHIPNGKELLTTSLLTHLQTAERLLRENKMYATVGSINKGDHIEYWDTEAAMIINLPENIATRALHCNFWVQKMTTAREAQKLFTEDPFWTVVKLAEGSWLPVGNIMIEVGQSGFRIQSPVHDRAGVTRKFGYRREETAMPYEDLTDHWVVTIHIIDSGLLKLLDQIGTETESPIPMIDSPHLSPSIYCRAYSEMLELIYLNPALDIRGVQSDWTWIFWNGNARRFPHQPATQLHEIAGQVVDLGSAEELGDKAQIRFATQNKARAAALQDGTFQPWIVANFVRSNKIANIIKKYGDEAAIQKLRAVQAKCGRM